jgi:3-carboxy-cis,cis-muconate cycloisomerase
MERKQMSKSVPIAATVIDSVLFRDAFGTPRMREVFSDHALVSRYVEVEIALARAEARCGVFPAEAADEIAAKCNITSLDFDLLRQETDIVGYSSCYARARPLVGKSALPQ